MNDFSPAFPDINVSPDADADAQGNFVDVVQRKDTNESTNKSNNIYGTNDSRLSTSRTSFTENIFQKQKKIIELAKMQNTAEMSSYQPSLDDVVEAKKSFSFSDLQQHFVYSPFTTMNQLGEEIPLIQNTNWSKTDLANVSASGIEIRNLIFKSVHQINYKIATAVIDANIILKGESTFWLALHTNNNFDIESAFISISKKDNSNSVFLSQGTFVQDLHKKLIYKVFCKQQLLDYSLTKNPVYAGNDTVSIRLNIIDQGSEPLQGKIFVNDSEKENKINGNFFIPTVKNFSLLIAGSGEQCKVKRFDVGTKYKGDYENYNSVRNNPIKGCDCCIVF